MSSSSLVGLEILAREGGDVMEVIESNSEKFDCSLFCFLSLKSIFEQNSFLNYVL